MTTQALSVTHIVVLSVRAGMAHTLAQLTFQMHRFRMLTTTVEIQIKMLVALGVSYQRKTQIGNIVMSPVVLKVTPLFILRIR